MRKFILSVVLGVGALVGTLMTPSKADAAWWNRGYYYTPYSSRYYTPYYGYSYPTYSYSNPTYSYYYDPGVTTYATPGVSYSYNPGVAPVTPGVSYYYDPGVSYYAPSYGYYRYRGWRGRW